MQVDPSVYQFLCVVSTLRVVSIPPLLHITFSYRIRISSSTYPTYPYHQLLRIPSTYWHFRFFAQLFLTQGAYQLFRVLALVLTLLRISAPNLLRISVPVLHKERISSFVYQLLY